MRRSVDLNCDLGELDGDEGLALDAAMILLVSSVNVACGQHAGDERRMSEIAGLCRSHSVAFGAHPGYADREHFGRRVIPLNEPQLRDLLLPQMELAARVAEQAGIELTHIKPHGALYNLAATDEPTAAAIASMIVSFSRKLQLFALSGSVLEASGQAAGLRVVSEAFADRAYDADGKLVSRSTEGAVLHDPDSIARRAVSMVLGQSVPTIHGTDLQLKISTLCVHGDTPDARRICSTIREHLRAAGVEIRRP